MPSSSPHQRDDLRSLSRLCGIASSYIGADGKEQVVPEQTLQKLMKSLFPGENFSDVEKLISQKRKAKIDAVLPGSVIAWDGRLGALWLWLRQKPDSVSLYMKSALNRMAHTFPKEELAILTRGIEGETYYRVKICLKKEIPFDSYYLRISTDYGLSAESFLISAPRQLNAAQRCWGCFAPAYALHSKNTQGIGGFRELAQTAEFLKNKGAAFLGTLPLLPLGGGKAPSPYSPMSRLFFNEIYLDLENLPEFTPKDLKALQNLNTGDLVQHEEVAKLKREIIQEAALDFFEKFPEGDEGYKKFKADSPYLEAYAIFCAKGDEADQKYHLYAQYACHLQMSALKEKVESDRAAALYLDYPVGVHPSGFDAHHFKELFIGDLSVGAPPDPFFSGGQNWGFRPLHPREIETDHYAYFRACLAHHLRYAKILRLDHIMGFYRIFCVDDDKEGSYIYYNFDAFLALLILEAWRHEAYLIGENLGVVPDIVNRKMAEHGINRMWIAFFNLKPDRDDTFDAIEPDMLASHNTHDMAPFEAFRSFSDIEKMNELGLKNDKEAKDEKEGREKLLKNWNRENLYMELVEGMAASPASFVMLTLEDLWKETNSQNLPGTMDNHPNWQRRFAVPFEKWTEQEFLTDAFEILNKHRDSQSL